MLFVDET
jgi:hypothetical protein